MAKNTESSRARQYWLFALWIMTVGLLVGVECAGLVECARLRTLHLTPRAWFTYFVPLFLALPFLLGLQTYREIKRRFSDQGAGLDVARAVAGGLVQMLIMTYVAFVVLIGLLSDAISILPR